MKKINKLFAVLLAMLLVISSLPISAAAAVDISDCLETQKVYSFSSINSDAPEDNVNRVYVTLTDKLPEAPVEEEEPEEPCDEEDPDNETPSGEEEPDNETPSGEEDPDNETPTDSGEPENETPSEAEEQGKITFINIDYTCEIDAYEYRIGFTKVGGGFQYMRYVQPEDRTVNGISCNGFTVSINLENYGFEAGDYYLNISRARTEAQCDKSKYGDGGNCYRNVIINIDENGAASIVDYSGIQQHNEAIYNDERYYNPDYYTDKTMEDVPYCLNDLINDTGAKTPSRLDSEKVSLTDAQLKYIETVAKRITKDSTGVYNKAKAIYSYVSENTFYDDYSHAHVNTIKTINNPYTNIKKIEDGKNAFTCCVGYSSMMCALLRSIDIPTRVVYGIHLSIPKESWTQNIDATAMREDDHYWVEFFNGERWVIADANMGTSNKWYRNGAQDEYNPGSTIYYAGGNRNEKAQNNFTFFDPSLEQFSSSHCSIGIFSKKHITDANDVEKLGGFLAQKNSSGKTNASVLGSAGGYLENGNIESWDLEKIYSNVFTGKLERIDFSGAKKLAGNADFSNCTGLRWFNASENTGITSLNLSGDTALESAYVSKCSVTDFKATGCPSLSKFSTNGNPLKSAEYTFRGNKTAKIKVTGSGTFQVAYEGGKHTMKSYAGDGYYFSGWYDSAGKKLSAAAEYSTSITASFTYTAKFLKLATPQNVKISAASSTGQTISWDKVAAADGYYLYKSTSKNSGFTIANKLVGASNTKVTKTGLETGKTYYYYVVAYKKTSGAAYTSYSIPTAVISKQVVPPTPSVTLSTGSKYVNVKFAKIANVTGYEIYRSTSANGTYSKIATVKQPGSSPITYKNSKLKKGKTYYYKVRAYKTVGSKKIYSAYSAKKGIKCK